MMFQRTSARPLLRSALLLCSAVLGTSAVTQALAASSSAATGDNADNTLVEIIVTARKQTETIQTIPESITAIDASTLTSSHLTRLDDFNSLVTNLNITQRADNTPDVVMRGVGTFGVVQGVGFYVNDVQQFEGQTVRPVDIERVEVLKGPQGTLFGGSNVGGAIKYVTKAPTDTLTGEGSIEYGRYNQQTVDGVVSGPIVPERLLARLSVFNDRSDGFLADPTLGRTLPKSNETGGRLTLEFSARQTKITFYLAADHMGSENMNLYYTPPDDNTYQRVYNGGVDGTVPSYRRNLYAPTLAITHYLGDLAFDSISSYFHSSIASVANFDKGALPVSTDPTDPLFGFKPFVNYIQGFGKSVWSQEFRLSSGGSSAFKWLAGAFVQRINSDASQIQNAGITSTIGSPAGVLMLLPGLLGPGPLSDVENRHVNRDYAIFGNASYDLRNWTFEAGLRIARFDNTMSDTTSSCSPCFGRVKDNAAVLPTASIAYHFPKDVMAYVTVARGDEEGDLSDNPDPAGVNEVLPFKTEFALSYEAGVKSSLFDRRLNLNVAGFYIDYTNRLFEVGRVLPGGGIFTYQTNVGSSRNYGFELDAVAHPWSELTLSGGVGLTRAIFGPVTFLDGFGNPVSANGNQAPYTPAYQATLAVDWRHRLSDELVLGTRVDTRFVGRSYWDAGGCSALAPGCPYEGFRYQQRTYQVVNTGVSLDVGKHWSVGAHVLNLFDEKYNTFFIPGSETGAPYNIAGINRPRQWFVSVHARY